MSRGPGFVTDLVQDLRNRNLLIPAIALIVAIIAVPILLGGGSGDEPPASAPAALSAPAMRGAEEVQPVVVTDVPGLRDFRKRLDGKGRNPFVQQTVDDGSGSGSGSGGGSGGSGGSGSSTATSVSGSTAATGSTATGSSTGSSVPPAPPSDTSSGGSSGGGSGGTENRLVKFTIDVRVGRAGKTKVLKDVDPLSLLPGDERPVVQYVNSDQDGSRAGFVVSPQVTEAKGDGKCDPGRDDCQFLFLEEGDLQKLVYGEKQETYRLELLAINRVLVPFDANAG